MKQYLPWPPWAKQQEIETILSVSLHPKWPMQVNSDCRCRRHYRVTFANVNTALSHRQFMKPCLHYQSLAWYWAFLTCLGHLVNHSRWPRQVKSNCRVSLLRVALAGIIVCKHCQCKWAFRHSSGASLFKALIQPLVCWTPKSDLTRTIKCDQIDSNDYYGLGHMSFCSTNRPLCYGKLC